MFSPRPADGLPPHAEITALEEHALLSRALGGDANAWTLFYARYSRIVSFAVSRVLRRYLGAFAEADLADLAAEVWAALLADDRRKLRCYDPARCRLSSWLALLATNCTIDQLRLGAGPGPRSDDDDALTAIADARPSADELVAARQQAALARRALAQLKAQERTFVLDCLDAHTAADELAHRLGISVNTVHSRKFKIREKLTRIVRRIERDARLRPAA
jgi:RNA polymerase sigma-70 factor (ECF subfamily)